MTPYLFVIHIPSRFGAFRAVSIYALDTCGHLCPLQPLEPMHTLSRGGGQPGQRRTIASKVLLTQKQRQYCSAQVLSAAGMPPMQ